MTIPILNNLVRSHCGLVADCFGNSFGSPMLRIEAMWCRTKSKT